MIAADTTVTAADSEVPGWDYPGQLGGVLRFEAEVIPGVSVADVFD